MGATVPVYVKVELKVEAWVIEDAVTIIEAKAQARQRPDVIAVLGASYEPPELEHRE